jgi:acetyl-CoA C-acetyltransferase
MTKQIHPRMPVIIGVGQYQMDVPKDLSNAPGPIEITARAIEAAVKDSGVLDIASRVDRLTAIRTFGDSGPMFPCPFGTPSNMPRSIAKAAHCDPQTGLYSPVGGDQPQTQTYETAKAIFNGESEMAIVCGGEAIANMKAAMRAGIKLDWSDDISAEGLIDEGPFPGGMLFNGEEIRHGLVSPLQFYALLETARRLSLDLSVEDYQLSMGELFAPFAKTAEENPMSMFRKSWSAEEIAKPTDKNPLLAEPYTKAMVAKDGVNQGAALIITTYENAKALGVEEKKTIYLHGFAKSEEPPVSEREDISSSPALESCLDEAINMAGIDKRDIQHVDFYSCFPIVVFNSCDILKDAPLNTLTQTGGLPFFGGPGNNYTLHGIAELVNTLREDRESFGLAQGNGGFMTKHAVGIYSARPPVNHIYETHSDATQKASQTIKLESKADEEGALLSYCLNYKKGEAKDATLLVSLKDSRRVLARFEGDLGQLPKIKKGQTVSVMSTPKGNIARLD